MSERYDTQIDDLDNELLVKKELIQELKAKYANMRDIYERHKEEIQVHRHKKFAERLVNQKMRVCLLLQKWWRGEIHRKNLLPIKKKESKTSHRRK